MTVDFFLHDGNETLEAELIKGDPGKAVIITHPHPLYGGNMKNPVVATISERFHQNGWTVVRFNFRGTGRSSGRFDNGEGEKDDVFSALSYLNASGYEHIALAGYSFGSRINAGVVADGADIADHIMVSPPVAFMSFDGVVRLWNTGLVVTGQADEIAPPGMIQDLFEKWQIQPEFEVIRGCDHFYSGCLDRLAGILDDYLLGNR